MRTIKIYPEFVKNNLNFKKRTETKMPVSTNIRSLYGTDNSVSHIRKRTREYRLTKIDENGREYVEIESITSVEKKKTKVCHELAFVYRDQTIKHQEHTQKMIAAADARACPVITEFEKLTREKKELENQLEEFCYERDIETDKYLQHTNQAVYQQMCEQKRVELDNFLHLNMRGGKHVFDEGIESEKEQIRETQLNLVEIFDLMKIPEEMWTWTMVLQFHTVTKKIGRPGYLNVHMIKGYPVAMYYKFFQGVKIHRITNGMTSEEGLLNEWPGNLIDEICLESDLPMISEYQDQQTKNLLEFSKTLSTPSESSIQIEVVSDSENQD
jgi:hypothetical protein